MPCGYFLLTLGGLDSVVPGMHWNDLTERPFLPPKVKDSILPLTGHSLTRHSRCIVLGHLVVSPLCASRGCARLRLIREQVWVRVISLTRSWCSSSSWVVFGNRSQTSDSKPCDWSHPGPGPIKGPVGTGWGDRSRVVSGTTWEPPGNPWGPLIAVPPRRFSRECGEFAPLGPRVVSTWPPLINSLKAVRMVWCFPLTRSRIAR